MLETVLLSDERVVNVPVHECGEPLLDLLEVGAFVIDRRLADPANAWRHLRAGVVDRLVAGQTLLPRGLRLLIVEGYRPEPLQRRYFAEYCARLRRENPDWPADLVRTHASAYICPPEVAPHVAGAAVDVTLCGPDGVELPMGTAVNASPVDTANACYTAATSITAEERGNRRVLGHALGTVGLVNYPTEWWHWSYGDRYWAFQTGQHAARYDAVAR